jgi:hypothetical protein
VVLFQDALYTKVVYKKETDNMNDVFVILRKKLIAIGLIFFLFLPVSNLFAQNWTRETTQDRWGDTTGYMYRQLVRSAIAHGDKDVSVLVLFIWSSEQGRDTLVIYSETTKDFAFHPGSGFLNENITFSLRGNGTTTSYRGNTDSGSGNFNKIFVLVTDAALINKSHGQGQWDVLIEGRNWYIRTTISGNLPRE